MYNHKGEIMKNAIIIGTIIFIVIAISISIAFKISIKKSYDRITDSSMIIETSLGNMEYSTSGKRSEDIPILMIHGAGGGFDQAQLLTDILLTENQYTVLPSRFGYLSSDFPENVNLNNQADAFKILLEHLEIEKVNIISMSAGGPPALQFAQNYPEMVNKLVLLSAGTVPNDSLEEEKAEKKGQALLKIVNSDFGYWFFSNAFKRRLVEFCGVPIQVYKNLPPEEQLLGTQFLTYMSPASQRARGNNIDHYVSKKSLNLKSIITPTLIIHAEDDSLQLFTNAEYAEEHLPNSQTSFFQTGGHMVLVTERESIKMKIETFFLE